MKRLIKPAIFWILCLVPLTILAQDSALKIPSEVNVFVGKEMTAIALESADLNGDGTMDFILVTEKTKAESDESADAEDVRSLLILTRGRAGKLTLAKRNDKAVYCKTCGGVMGDPFASVDVTRNSFTVNNYGGSSWRWSESYQFNYSGLDDTWQLVRVSSETFNSLIPKKVKTKIRTPKNFGKIDINDFDPAVIR